MKKQAWSMAELAVSLTIITVLAIFACNVVKPKTIKNQFFAYTSIKNIEEAIATLANDNGNLSPDGTDSWICKQAADAFNSKTTPDCTSTKEETVNFTMSNDVTIQGLSAAWNVYGYKDIVIDIDGKKGYNKLGQDRFPLRIYDGGDLTGVVAPVNCNSSVAGKVCNDGFDMNGTKSKINFTNNAEIISYDVFQIPDEDSTEAHSRATSRTFKEADCGAYGGLGVYSIQECNSSGYKTIKDCLTSEICLTCNTGGVNICPDSTTAANCESKVSEYNPNNMSCFAIVHKPSAGASLIFEPLIQLLL